MPALQVKECPSSTYEQLRLCAAEENRSISQQALTIIQDYLDARQAARNGVAPTAPRSRTAYMATSAVPVAHSADDYIGKRKDAFARLDALPAIPVTKKAPGTADLLAAIREEEAR